MSILRIENLHVNISKPIIAVGIDLGTTNSIASAATLYPDGKMELKVLDIPQPTETGEIVSPLVPSVVVELEDGSMIVGEGAKRLRALPEKANLVFEKNLFYNTKNEMGLRKKYYKAKEHLNHASKIAGVILGFLKKEIEKQLNHVDHVCITVPASFQLNQRRDTLFASQLAHINIKDDDLLDEPTAALIDYFFNHDINSIMGGRNQINALVFDFGGGTCDVSIVKIMRDKKGELLISEIAVSRYHRLGGGDIDAAIVHKILIPRLLKENNLDRLDLSWAEKKKGLEPQLLSVAEALKITLSREMEKLLKFDKYNKSTEIKATQPAVMCRLGKRVLALSRVEISSSEFEEILKPFLDEEFLYPKEDEFTFSQSIFSPITDSLRRASMKREDVDFCLLVGGSSLIPQVRIAIGEFFKNSKVGYYKDPIDMQTAVAKGAALNSLIKYITGRALIKPTIHEDISLITENRDKYPLIKAGTPLPFPEDSSYKSIRLVLPEDYEPYQDLKIEIVGGDSNQVIFN